MLIDATLREGEQSYGAYFSVQAKKDLVAGLLAVGVEEIELGCVGQEDLGGLMEWARPLWRSGRAGRSAALSVWSPAREQSMLAALALAPDRLNIGLPVSDRHMRERLGLDRTGLLERLRSVLACALGAGARYVSVGLEDFSRADSEFALAAAREAEAHGASRVRLSDSVGLFTPMRVAGLVHWFSRNLSIPVAVHCHDDFGMAAANAVTALESGAAFADVSVLGLGERAGISPLEEVAAHLALNARTASYRLEKIRDLCELVAAETGIPIPRTKAVAGARVFACESGLHVHAMERDPGLFEPYDPDAVGARRVIGVGKKSGRAAVALAASRLGVKVDGRDLPDLVRRVRACSARLGRPLNEADLRKTLADFAQPGAPRPR